MSDLDTLAQQLEDTTPVRGSLRLFALFAAASVLLVGGTIGAAHAIAPEPTPYSAPLVVDVVPEDRKQELVADGVETFDQWDELLAEDPDVEVHRQMDQVKSQWVSDEKHQKFAQLIPDDDVEALMGVSVSEELGEELVMFCQAALDGVEIPAVPGTLLDRELIDLVVGVYCPELTTKGVAGE